MLKFLLVSLFFISSLFANNDLVIKVKKGDNLSTILQSSGVSANEAFLITSELKNLYDPKNLRIGQDITINFDVKNDNDVDFNHLTIEPDKLRTITLKKLNEDIYLAKESKKPLKKRTLKIETAIDGSLFKTANNHDVPIPLMMNLIKILSYEVDFQRDIRQGNKFTLLFEEIFTEEGDIVDSNLIFAQIDLSKKNIAIYQHYDKNGNVEYFNEEGETIKSAMLRTPVDGARISSKFGRRKHPVLGYTKMHKGIDFAAPRGTPIYASGDGIIVERKRKGSYGNYIKIRHKGNIYSAYAHISKFAKGTYRGKKVNQGEVIAYVGTTGRSTGPHLHYEIIKNGKQINPLSINSAPVTKLTGVERGIFIKKKNQISELLKNSQIKFAKNNDNSS